MTVTQLELDLGLPRPPAPPTPRFLLELDVVVCSICSDHHPAERCPRRVCCPLCTGPHHASAHLARSSPS